MKTPLSILAILILSLIPYTVLSNEYGDVRIMILNQKSDLYVPGEEVKLSLRVSYKDLPVRSRVYVHLLPVSDTSWAMEGGGVLSVQSPSLNFKGTFVDKDNSHFSIASSNYPISMLIKENQVASALGSMFGSSPETVSEIAKSICGNKEGFGFTLGFLFSVGNKSSGSEDVTLSFTVPNYPKYYNGVIITPFILTREPDNSQTVYMNAKHMFSAKIKVKPNRKKENQENKVTYDDLPGIAKISSIKPSDASIIPGSPNTIEYHIDYKDLKAGTAIYLGMIPKIGDKIITKVGSGSVSSMKGIGKLTFFDEKSPYLRIPIENSPALISPFGFESALVSVIKDGGEGKTSGMVTFVPPVFAKTYQSIYVFPILIIPTSSGKRALLDKRLEGVNIANTEW